MNPDPSRTPGPLLGRSSAMADLRSFLKKASAVDAPVLLVGESGTGKSHLAHLLHRRGPRSNGPLVSVNCAGIPDGLFEAEFFGQRKGAFTGASESRPGLFEQASGGSLFLDEVGELPGHQQAKLLAVLEDGLVRRVGGTKVRSVDVRVVSATCRDMERAVADGAFRMDLYHRLALLRCRIPPLRERPVDLDPLVDHLTDTVARRHGVARITLSDGARVRLRDHGWPGNIRELAHVLEAAFILAGRERLEGTDLSAVMSADEWNHSDPGHSSDLAVDVAAGLSETGTTPRRRPPRYSFYGSPDEEREAIVAALSRNRGNRTQTARELGMARNTLRTRMRRYGI